ncbi:hypothetical protein EW026_g4985 [Hermanssonia centrifuga]|uniref:Uncharacterized protein n=1 Tax=Hermanssonia centrifuga TaxID=98765 RepID=A0A4S4KFR1_9APHY|nr:hypothetical protein EW026_g4985 [Hermanssonia centrifuga]
MAIPVVALPPAGEGDNSEIVAPDATPSQLCAEETADAADPRKHEETATPTGVTNSEAEPATVTAAATAGQVMKGSTIFVPQVKNTTNCTWAHNHPNGTRAEWDSYWAKLSGEEKKRFDREARRLAAEAKANLKAKE